MNTTQKRPKQINDHLQKVDYQAFEDLETYLLFLENKIDRLEGVLASIGDQVRNTLKGA